MPKFFVCFICAFVLSLCAHPLSVLSLRCKNCGLCRKPWRFSMSGSAHAAKHSIISHLTASISSLRSLESSDSSRVLFDLKSLAIQIARFGSCRVSHRVLQGCPRGGDKFTSLFRVLQTLYSKRQSTLSHLKSCNPFGGTPSSTA